MRELPPKPAATFEGCTAPSFWYWLAVMGGGRVKELHELTHTSKVTSKHTVMLESLSFAR